uniref:NADH-ubiquinone oxidoreductase chain 3 n=1 Tax=Oopsacas minuta TaxID=111878 RepID=A0A0G3ZCQ8_9METZ|nr:NADH dehydrogenase subunit 3 [Oopsacas minuta]AKM54872.1 NADH dehydrogenase subunit 3 [Oopsacas minuta]
MKQEEFTPMFMMLMISMIFSLILLLISTMTSKNMPEPEKMSVYECGFDPLKTPRLPFSMKFFLMGMLFLMFDLEISYIFPWCTTMKEMKWTSFMTMILFMMMLTLGFMYEWLKEGLEWE